MVMTDDEIREYLRVPEHERDRQAFRADQIARARLILNADPSPILQMDKQTA